MAATSPEILLDQGPGAHMGTDHIAALTGLRGFAALVVVVVHCSSLTAFPWVGFHSYGPIALFVLSGFLLFQPWSRWMTGSGQRPSIRRFAWRRLWRIFPAYLVLLGLVTLVFPPSRPSGVADWLHAITLTHIYEPAALTRGLFHTWSLGTELSWYVVLPLVGLWLGVWIGRSHGSATAVLLGAVATALVVTVAWRWVGTVHIDDASTKLVFSVSFPSFAVCFAGGAFVGHLIVERNAGRRNLGTRVLGWLGRHPGPTFVLAITMGVIGASRFGGPWTVMPSTLLESTLRWTSMTMMALTLVAGVASAPPGSWLARMFGSRPMAAIGRWSFGIYLWHMPLLLILHREFGVFSGGLGLVMWTLLVAVVSIPFGAGTYHFVERPAVAFSKRHTIGPGKHAQQPS